ncbi:MAG: RluA family pseudouridine synthase [Lachnospiraceae bacterium]|jgi:23S rRNA pseudouridine1911/1915/1917 synthase
MSADNSKISAAGPSGPTAAAGETSRETGKNLRRESGEADETDADEWAFTVASASAGTRLDRALAGQLPEYSRSYLQKLTENGRTEVNGKTAAKCGMKLKAGDEVHIVIPEPEPLKVAAEPIPLDILYEDSDVIVVNKPKGMVVHPAAGHTGGTLVNALLYHCGSSLSGINGTARPGIVHRIDRDTTGVLIACKNDHAHLKIAEQLKEHSVTRRYAAIVCGNLKEDSGVIDSPIGRDPADRKKMACGVRNGKRAVTHWRVLERFRGYTYIECRLETGRTHQIRVHMASIGHPLLGDTLYGGQKSFPGFDLQGQTLHAYILGFIHPATGEYLEFTAPLPDYFADLLTALRKRS